MASGRYYAPSCYWKTFADKLVNINLIVAKIILLNVSYCTHLSDGQDQLTRVRFSSSSDEVDDLVVGHGGHVPPVDHHHLVALVEAGHALVRWRAHRHPGHDHGDALVGPALYVEPKPSLSVGVDGDCDNTTATAVVTGHDDVDDV